MARLINGHFTGNFFKLFFTNYFRLFYIPSERSYQDCQIVYFKTKNPNLGVYWRALECKMFVYFTAIWYNLLSLGIIYVWSFGIVSGHLVYFSLLWYVWTKKNLATLDPTYVRIFCSLNEWSRLRLLSPRRQVKARDHRNLRARRRIIHEYMNAGWPNRPKIHGVSPSWHGYPSPF
jgi:hypothetical protein